MNWLGPDQPEGEPVPGPLAEQAVRLALVHRAQQPDTRDPRTGHTLEQSFAIRVRWRAAVRTIARLLRRLILARLLTTSSLRRSV